MVFVLILFTFCLKHSDATKGDVERYKGFLEIKQRDSDDKRFRDHWPESY